MIGNREIRILLIEDDEDDYVLTRDLLADSRRTRFGLDWVTSFDEALAAMGKGEHDVYLVDYRLGQHDGLEVLREARAAGCLRPIILLTGQGDGDVDIAAMKAGAADYLVKGQIEGTELLCTLYDIIAQHRARRSC